MEVTYCTNSLISIVAPSSIHNRSLCFEIVKLKWLLKRGGTNFLRPLVNIVIIRTSALMWTRYSDSVTSMFCEFVWGAVRGVLGSTLAFGSIGHGFKSEHCLFSHHSACLQQAEITGEVLTGGFISSTAVVHLASHPPPGRVNRVASVPVVVLRG